jgi:hypothetical protein
MAMTNTLILTLNPAIAKVLKAAIEAVLADGASAAQLTLTTDDGHPIELLIQGDNYD